MVGLIDWAKATCAGRRPALGTTVRMSSRSAVVGAAQKRDVLPPAWPDGPTQEDPAARSRVSGGRR